jgi:hypothetical protein
VSATRHLTPTPTPHVWASYLAGGG